jgi:hypothetical protein
VASGRSNSVIAASIASASRPSRPTSPAWPILWALPWLFPWADPCGQPPGFRSHWSQPARSRAAQPEYASQEVRQPGRQSHHVWRSPRRGWACHQPA